MRSPRSSFEGRLSPSIAFWWPPGCSRIARDWQHTHTIQCPRSDPLRRAQVRRARLGAGIPRDDYHDGPLGIVDSYTASTDRGLHILDNLTESQRRRCMASVRTTNTGLEQRVQVALRRRGLRFKKNARDLPGRPDLVFLVARVVVFVDGDFWHGYRFPAWRNRQSKFWQEKIDRNRRRDRRNFAALRRLGWSVVRIWQHEIERDLDACISRIESEILRTRTPRSHNS